MEITKEEIEKKMKEMTHEERTLSMRMSLHWVCAVIDECEMNTETTPVKELLSVLFGIMHHQED